MLIKMIHGFMQKTCPAVMSLSNKMKTMKQCFHFFYSFYIKFLFSKVHVQNEFFRHLKVKYQAISPAKFKPDFKWLFLMAYRGRTSSVFFNLILLF